MSMDLWLAFAVTSSILLVIPGPTILTVITYALKHGTKATTSLVLAVALGDATAVSLSLLGLGALLATSSLLFGLVKILGGLYLIYLGVTFLLDKLSTNSKIETKIEAKKKPNAIFINTFMVTALNPKGIVFFIAFLPQFIDRELAVTPQLIIMAITFVMLGAINSAMYVLLANRASKKLSSPKTQRVFKITGGSLLCLAGLWTLTSKRA